MKISNFSSAPAHTHPASISLLKNSGFCSGKPSSAPAMESLSALLIIFQIFGFFSATHGLWSAILGASQNFDLLKFSYGHSFFEFHAASFFREFRVSFSALFFISFEPLVWLAPPYSH